MRARKPRGILVNLGLLVVLHAAGSMLLAQENRIQPSDLFQLRSVGEVQFSPDGTRLAYTVVNNGESGRPYSQISILNIAAGKTTHIGSHKEASGGFMWSPDSRSIAYHGSIAEKHGLVVADADGTNPRFLSETQGTNSPLPSTGRDIAWSPDSKRIAFVSSTPGPETENASGDPMIITRYLYRPSAAEGKTHFNDNRRTHIFLVDAAGGEATQLTSGTSSEHSIDWSPNGDEILFVSNRESDQDQFFNYDIFAVRVTDGAVRRITTTESCEYRPLWSADGKRILFLASKRGLTDLETTMEDTHVWIMKADGTEKIELGASVDNRQHTAGWAPDGNAVYFTVEERGNVKLERLPLSGGRPDIVWGERGSVGSWSAVNDKLAFTFASPSDYSEIYERSGSDTPKKWTDLNSDVLRRKQIAEVEPLTFISNDNKYQVEAYLTKPIGMISTSKYPLIVNIHGGPHGQNGPAFNFRNQVYAAHGWAVLMVNYRGSTGYGQAFADAVFGDQDGNEAQDVLYGLSAAMRRYLWVDRERLGCEGVSYGGELTAWLITQTRQFRAAIPIAAITNLISYNYMTYYNQYEQMEFGVLPHQGNMMDVLWERSPLKHVAQIATPTLLMHGEYDNDVPIAEAEQFFIALKDVGVDTVMVRYPREGHGLQEPKHVVDAIERSIRWYENHFPGSDARH